MSKQLVIVDFDPKGKPRMDESLVQQGHKFVMALIREDGLADTKPQIFHCTPNMLENALDESEEVEEIPEEKKKAPVKKAAPTKAATKKRR